MKNLQKFGFWISLLILIAAFVWSLWPSPLIDTSFQLNANTSILIEDVDCIEFNDLADYQFMVIYPEFINIHKSNTLSTLVKKISKEPIYEKEIKCNTNLELFLDLDKAFIEPSSNIIQQFPWFKDQTIRFEISPAQKTGKISGSLWIYLNLTPISDSGTERIPLFTIPVEIHNRSLFGIAPGLVQIISLSALISVISFKLVSQWLSRKLG